MLNLSKDARRGLPTMLRQARHDNQGIKNKKMSL
ncbi:MAG: hypothetical protein JWR38_3064 [Mucilaginibacter sp.]|nr:hypothetical protein [Mucilaginibacter sp.]